MAGGHRVVMDVNTPKGSLPVAFFRPAGVGGCRQVESDGGGGGEGREGEGEGGEGGGGGEVQVGVMPSTLCPYVYMTCTLWVHWG